MYSVTAGHLSDWKGDVLTGMSISRMRGGLVGQEKGSRQFLVRERGEIGRTPLRLYHVWRTPTAVRYECDDLKWKKARSKKAHDLQNTRLGTFAKRGVTER